MTCWPYSREYVKKCIKTNNYPSVQEVRENQIKDRNTREYTIIQNKQTKAVVHPLLSKRGNIEYARRKRIQCTEIFNAMDKMDFSCDIPSSRGYAMKRTQAILVTGTFDRNKWSAFEAYSQLSYILNLFKAKFTKILKREGLGRYVSFAVKESTVTGHPAPHILIFLEIPVIAFKYNGKWRVQSNAVRKAIQEAWGSVSKGSFADVLAVIDNKVTVYDPVTKQTRTRSTLRYMLKYMTYSYQDNPNDADHIIADNTHAMYKFFGLRDIFGKDFKTVLGILPEGKDTRLEMVLNELKLNHQRKLAMEHRFQSCRFAFGFLSSPLYNDYLNTCARIEQLKAELERIRPPSEWEFMGSQVFPPNTPRAVILAFFKAVSGHNDLMDTLATLKTDLQNPAFIQAMIEPPKATTDMATATMNAMTDLSTGGVA